MGPLIRRRPLLRATAIGGGAYYSGKRRIEAAASETGNPVRGDAEENRFQPPPGPRRAGASGRVKRKQEEELDE